LGQPLELFPCCLPVYSHVRPTLSPDREPRCRGATGPAIHIGQPNYLTAWRSTRSESISS
jgi:hypothetical protein